MVQLTCYDGVGKIGGNKFLLEDGDTRLFLDMGQAFDLLQRFFVDPWLMPRIRFGLRDHLALGLVPPLPGLYDPAKLEGTSLAPEEAAFDGVFISHPHFDHIYHVQFLHPEIPVHLGETARLITEAWEQTSSRMSLGERSYRPFRTGDTVEVHGVDVEPIHVDHSVPGAYGFLVHTSQGPVAYTGDLRTHGPHGEMTQDFVEAVREARPLALLTEGTRMAREERHEEHTEEEVHEGARAIVQGAGERLVVVTFYPRDIDRMRSFYMAATEAGREFVVAARTALLLTTLEADTGLHFPRVFRDYEAKAYFRSLTQPSRWEQALREELGDRAVDAPWVHDHQGEVVLQLDFSHLAELVDIDPIPGGHFIHSKSEPFEEDDLQDKVLRAWLRRFGLRHHQLHASGHASRAELEEMVRGMRPGKVVPIHTEHPELFVGLTPDVELPQVGRPIPL